MRKRLSQQAAIASFRSLCNESDKGCTIIIASILDERLRRLHEVHVAAATYPSRTKIFKELCCPHAPLSGFAGKIQIAYAYGLIPSKDYEDLQIVRKLRNEAAHSIFDFSLQDNGVRAVAMRLQAYARCQQTANKLEKNLRGTKGDLDLPELTEAKRHLIVNGLALHRLILAKLVDAIECLLIKRRGKRLKPNSLTT
jgi:hypothetical protein